MSLITNEHVQKDFQEAINCYNNGNYNAAMIMARRTIQQEMSHRKATGDNLYKQIQNSNLSQQQKKILDRVKNFGNHGAHSDFCLYDDNGDPFEDQKTVAELSLKFLEIYFKIVYEIDALLEVAPDKSQKLSAEKSK
ncbi:MAG: DUF4145 domain-containing protein [Salinispira sp.]